MGSTTATNIRSGSEDGSTSSDDDGSSNKMSSETTTSDEEQEGRNHTEKEGGPTLDLPPPVIFTLYPMYLMNSYSKIYMYEYSENLKVRLNNSNLDKIITILTHHSPS